MTPIRRTARTVYVGDALAEGRLAVLLLAQKAVEAYFAVDMDSFTPTDAVRSLAEYELLGPDDRAEVDREARKIILGRL